MEKQKFSEQFTDLLVELGYTRCFFLAGGNSMHLLEAASRKFECIPFTHEVSAVIASEYANVVSREKSWVLVTAGPGLTNAVTGIAGSWLESRHLLVVGGQVKIQDLNRGEVRQRGIQEVNGVDLVRSITKGALRVEPETTMGEIEELILSSNRDRKGPVFIEVPIDISAANTRKAHRVIGMNLLDEVKFEELAKAENSIISLLEQSSRPVFLIGQGATKGIAKDFAEACLEAGIPVATTWTGADRVGFDMPNYVGRPNFYGMRSSNLIVQKSDLVVALGARLGLQQTGFNVKEFAPHAKIIQVDVDVRELSRDLPRKDLIINLDCNPLLEALTTRIVRDAQWTPWLEHCQQVMKAFPMVEQRAMKDRNYLNPYLVIERVSGILESEEIVVSCSSGGTFTAFMQSFRNKTDQTIISNKGLASMGYGLAGAIGASIASNSGRVILFEGDGGFVQNLQELGTVMAQNLPLKMFIFDNSGYASIRTSQNSYFRGNYIGCDTSTGLGMPSWPAIASAYGIDYVDLTHDVRDKDLAELISSPGPLLIRIAVDPNLTYLPKILSRVSEDGGMISNALHKMHPEIDLGKSELAMRFIRG